MKKVLILIAVVIVLVLGYAGMKAVDLGADYIAEKKERMQPYYAPENVVSLGCKQGATDSDVVRTGKRAMELIATGFRVYVCGKEITFEQAMEMADY